LEGFRGKSRSSGQVWREQEGLEKNGGLKPRRYKCKRLGGATEP
jgi:hypothetical protein